ncbi:5818_t:CDS:2 [Funneliformis caledonium]|uniref:5818_t:CDS:1 n=1 Tax=Funneliformis caledonium TaxID=1117310 RepID=A0A9N9BBJ5_9GLOM|nr:5818_t:CDS:2 [Funneliformis caledonium]
MPKLTGDKLEIRIDPELEGEQQVHVLVTYNKTTFQSNDRQKSGRTIHVSDFLTDTIGRLKLDKKEIDDTIPNEARIMINSGKNFDG